jgi:signal transduction histidine kinase
MTENSKHDLPELLDHVIHCWDDERRALARQLHDNVGSALTALSMHLSLLSAKLPPDKALLDRSAQMKQLLLQIVNSNRAMQLKLWNDKLEFLGIKAALNELVDEFGRAHGLGARASLPDEDIAPTPAQAVLLLRFAEEGLDNVRRHAGASAVELVLDVDEDGYAATLRDNGNGGARIGEGRSCHGLRLLRERAAYLGGSLTAGPGAQGGSVVRLAFPLLSAASPAASSA